MLDATVLATGEKVAVAIDVTDEAVDRIARQAFPLAFGPGGDHASMQAVQEETREIVRRVLAAASQGTDPRQED